MSRYGRALTTLALFSLPLLAREHPAIERGFAADKIYQFSDLDQVSFLDGALSLTIPVGGAYPLSERLAYGLTLTYGSKIWEFDESAGGPGNPAVRSVPRALDNAGMGWRVSLGQLLSPDHPSNDDAQLWKYASPSGGLHTLYAQLHQPDPVTAGTFYSKDSAYLRMREIAGGERVVEFPSGEVHTFRADGKIRRIADVYDSFVNITYPDANTWTLTDRHGRVQTIRFESASSDGETIKIIDKIEPDRVRRHHRGLRLQLHQPRDSSRLHRHLSRPADHHRERAAARFPHPARRHVVRLHLRRVRRLRRGALRSATLPTRGKIEYGYRRWELPTEGCTEEYETHWAHDSLGIWTRTFYDAAGNDLGSWSYFQELTDPPSTSTGQCSGTAGTDPAQVSVTTVTAPSGDKTRYFFSVWPNQVPAQGTADGFLAVEYGLPINKLLPDPLNANRFLSVEQQDCDAGGGNCETVRSRYVGYDWEQACLIEHDPTCQDLNRRVATERTVFPRRFRSLCHG